MTSTSSSRFNSTTRQSPPSPACSLFSRSLSFSPRRKPRLLVIAAGVLAFSAVTAFGFAPLAPDAALLPTEVVSQQLTLPSLDAQREALDQAGYKFDQIERIRRGDTIASLLNRLGVSDAAAENFIRRDPQAKMLYRLRQGRTIHVRIDAQGGLLRLDYLHTPVVNDTPGSGANQSRALVIERVAEREAVGDNFRARSELLQNERRLQLANGEIESSLFVATDAAGIPDSIATQITEIFSGDLDFYRGLHRGDRFSVVYEMFYQDGERTRPGRLLAVEFVNGGKAHQAVWYPSAVGSDSHQAAGNYYAPDGQSLRRAFMRTPIEFSRISAGFGGRLHPILNSWRQHTGIDYAAPTGAPIRVTGDGVVAFVGRQGGYGNAVVIQHQGVYSTLYGHMSAFAKGLVQGAPVAQGQVIGYVGMTGWATGPHLHYEFRIANVAQDPLRVAMPNAVPIPHEQLSAFRARTTDLTRQIDLLRSVGAG